MEDELQETGNYLRVRTTNQLPPDGPGARVFRGAEHDAHVTVAMIAMALGESQPVHTHPTAEVLVVQRGVGLITLGRWQARLVREGEIVRVPAGVEHAVRNAGTELFTAVAAYAADTLITEPADASAPLTTAPPRAG